MSKTHPPPPPQKKVEVDEESKFTGVIISSIYRNFSHCHKNTQHNTLCFGSKLLPASGETTNPKTQISKHVTQTST
jgi:hypothetical protein